MVQLAIKRCGTPCFSGEAAAETADLAESEAAIRAFEAKERNRLVAVVAWPACFRAAELAVLKRLLRPVRALFPCLVLVCQVVPDIASFCRLKGAPELLFLNFNATLVLAQKHLLIVQNARAGLWDLPFYTALKAKLVATDAGHVVAARLE